MLTALFAKTKQIFGNYNLWPPIYTMNHPVIIVCSCMEKSIGLKRVNVLSVLHSIVCILFPDVEVACTNYEGVDAVKRALKKGLELSTETMPIKVNIACHIRDV